MSDTLRLAYRRAFASGDPSLLQIAFNAAVLERYRGSEAYSLVRSDTVGRVKKQGAWSLDVGIIDGGKLIHASWRDLVDNLPGTEREHWAQHAVMDCSDMFIRMRMTPGSCFDDGDARPWT